MKEFIKSLLTNRSGLIYGILSLCCIPVYKFLTAYFPLSIETKVLLECLFECANLPAVIFSDVFQALTGMIFLPFFIVAQWLSIGVFAKYLAREFTGK